MPLTGPLTEQEKKNAKEIFDALDASGDGKITSAELKQVLTGAGFELSEAEAKKVIAMADKDNSGAVTWDEFLKVAEKRPIKTKIAAALKDLFAEFDTDKSGFIDEKDLRKLVDQAGNGKDISDKDLKDLVKKVDTSGDGKISFDEFVAVFLD